MIKECFNFIITGGICMFVALCFDIIVILSSYYLLYKNKISCHDNKKIIIASLFYIIMRSLPITHINLIDQCFSFLVLIIAMILMSNNKIQAIYYALIIFIIKDCLLILGLNLQIWYFDYVPYALIVEGLLLMLIVFVLNKYHFIQYNQLSFIFNVVCLIGLILISRSFTVVESKNPIYITVSYLIGWIFINKVISIYSEKKIIK